MATAGGAGAAGSLAGSSSVQLDWGAFWGVAVGVGAVRHAIVVRSSRPPIMLIILFMP